MKNVSPGWTLMRIYTVLIYVFMFAPIVVVIVLAFNPKQFGIFPMEGVSWRWFIKLAQNDSIIDAFKKLTDSGLLDRRDLHRHRHSGGNGLYPLRISRQKYP